MNSSPSVFIFCGEPSADIHGSMLAKNLLLLNPGIKISGVGGARLKEAGVDIIRDNHDLAIVGFGEVIRQYGKFKTLLVDMAGFIESKKIPVVILIDYPGFNLRLAKVLKGKTKVIYYISPQIWAWGKRRIEVIKKYIDHMIVIFSFEKDFYQGFKVPVSFVGHPLLDHFDNELDTTELTRFLQCEDKGPLIAFLPGSRKSEVKRLLPIYMKTINILRATYPEAKFVISAASKDRLNEIKQFLKDMDQLSMKEVFVFPGDMNQILKEADFVVVASGTASLQTALYLKPMAVVYKVNPLFYWMMRFLIETKYISMVNLILNEKVVPELIQNDCNPNKIASTVISFLEDQEHSDKLIHKLVKMREMLGTKGASLRAAEIVKGFLNENN